FFTPFTPHYVQKDDRVDSRGAILHELFTLAELDERNQITEAIGQLGIPIIPVGPGTTLNQAMRDLAARSRRRR
ncbi:MAG: hypothetical protein AAFS10_16395, partial [Myxococcota bacterium]